MRRIADASAMGLAFPIAIAIGYFWGRSLDRFLGTVPMADVHLHGPRSRRRASSTPSGSRCGSARRRTGPGKASRGSEMVVRRAAPIALLLALAASLVVMILGRPGAALWLTASAVIGILSTICLEAALVRILQPGKPRFSRVAAALLIVVISPSGRVFLAALYRWRDAVEWWAVAAGIGCYLARSVHGGDRTSAGVPRGRSDPPCTTSSRFSSIRSTRY